MTSPNILLLFGYDPDLLKTRRLVLEQAGFAIRSVGTLALTGQLLAEWRPALLVLCHTVPEKECHMAMAMAMHCAPAVPVVALLASRGPCAEGATAVVDSLGGPSLLLAKIGSLLHVEAADCRSRTQP